MLTRRNHNASKYKRINRAKKAAAVRWGNSGPREPDCECVETLTYIGVDGRARRIGWRRGRHGRMVLSDGETTTATALAARVRGWLGRMPEIRE